MVEIGGKNMYGYELYFKGWFIKERKAQYKTHKEAETEGKIAMKEDREERMYHPQYKNYNLVITEN